MRQRNSLQQVRPNDESYGLQWNFDAINLPFAWEVSGVAAPIDARPDECGAGFVDARRVLRGLGLAR